MLLLFTAVGVSAALLAASLGDADKPGQDVTVRSSGYVDDTSSPYVRSDADPRQPVVLPPDSADTVTADTVTAGTETQYAEVDGSPDADGGMPPPASPPAPPPEESGLTVWQDRDDDGFNAGEGHGPITGRVTDPWGNGIPGVEVYLDYALAICYKGCGGYYEPAAVTDSLGYYSAWKTSYHSYAEYEDWTEGGGSDRFGQPWRAGFSDGPELTGSHTVYFNGQVRGYRASEWYNNKRLTDYGYYQTGSPGDSVFVAAGSSGIDAVLVPDGTIVGHVLGDKADYMKIIAFRADAPEPANANTYSGVSYISQSAFSLNDLPPGSYKLVAVPAISGWPLEHAENYLCSWFQLSRSWETARTITVGPGQRLSLDFQLLEPQQNGPSLRGNFYIENMPPHPGTVLSLVEADNPSRVISQKTVSYTDFSFEFSSLPKGDYKLKCTLPGSGHTIWYQQNYDPFHDEPGVDEADVINAGPDMVLDPIIFSIYPYGAVVSGSVKFQDGSPLVNEIVYARRITTTGYQNQPSTWTSGDNGQYSFGRTSNDPNCYLCNLGWNRLSPGSYQLCVSDGPTGAEYCYPQILTVDWYDTLTGVDIIVPNDFGTPFEVTGRVTSPDGIGVAGATVRLDSAYMDISEINVSTDADGYYRVERADGLQPATYNIYAIVNGISHKRDQDDGYIYISWRQALENIDIIIPESVRADGYG